jgi:murein DD-endopeptidase MepM/ murein hydrolase activator NlpD
MRSMIVAVCFGCLLGAYIPAFALEPAAARAAMPGSPPAARASFGWPLKPPKIARPFHAPDSAYGAGHRGVDLAGDIGQPVLAAGAGLVRYAGRMVDRDVVTVEHPGGLRSTYEPVAATTTVGQQVARGQPLGHLQPGHPACAADRPKVCLHWGIRRGENYLDPLWLLGEGKVRLLPWDDSPPH